MFTRLFVTLRFPISKLVQKNNRFAKDAMKLKKKLKDVRQTAGQAEQLSSYVQSKSKQEIAGKIDQMSRNEQQLRDYINKFNQDSSNRINIMDLSNYVRQYNDLAQPGLKKHELELLQEFRKRRMDFKAQEFLSKIDEEPSDGDEGEEGMPRQRRRKSQLERWHSNQEFTESLKTFELKEFHEKKGHEKQQSQLNEFSSLDKEFNKEWRDPDFSKQFNFEGIGTNRKVQSTIPRGLFRQGIFDIRDNFICLILDRDSTTKVTTLNRVNTCRTIVFMGNGTGLMAYGRGRGISHKVALKRAIFNCKRNIIAIPIDPTLCVPEQLYAHFQDYKVTLRPSTRFNPWGHPVFATMLSVAGMFDCGFKTVHTGKNHYNVINSLFKVATKNRTPQEISERDGRKIYRTQWIKPMPAKALGLDKAILR